MVTSEDANGSSPARDETHLQCNGTAAGSPQPSAQGDDGITRRYLHPLGCLFLKLWRRH